MPFAQTLPVALAFQERTSSATRMLLDSFSEMHVRFPELTRRKKKLETPAVLTLKRVV